MRITALAILAAVTAGCQSPLVERDLEPLRQPIVPGGTVRVEAVALDPSADVAWVHRTFWGLDLIRRQRRPLEPGLAIDVVRRAIEEQLVESGFRLAAPGERADWFVAVDVEDVEVRTEDRFDQPSPGQRSAVLDLTILIKRASDGAILARGDHVGWTIFEGAAVGRDGTGAPALVPTDPDPAYWAARGALHEFLTLNRPLYDSSSLDGSSGTSLEEGSGRAETIPVASGRPDAPGPDRTSETVRPARRRSFAPSSPR